MPRPGPSSRRWMPLAILAAVLGMAGLGWWLATWPDRHDDGVRSERARLAADVAPPATDPDLPAFEAGEVESVEPSGARVSATTTPAPVELQETLLVGRVLRPSGSSVPGARVVVSNTERALQHEVLRLLAASEVDSTEPRTSGREYRWGAVLCSSADGAGTFRVRLSRPAIESLGGGPLFVGAIAEGRDLAIQAWGSLEAGTTDFGDIVLPACAAIRLRVPYGPPPPEGGVEYTAAEVAVRPLAPDDAWSSLGSWLQRRWVPSHGSVLAAGLPPGVVEVRVTAPDVRDVRFPRIELVAGQVVDLGEVALEDGESITGVVVTSDGTPTGDAQLNVCAEAEPTPQVRGEFEVAGRRDQWVRLDDEGRFSVGGLDPGAYDLFIEIPGFAGAELAGVQAGQSDVRLVVQRPATVLLTLLDAATGAPIDGAEITGQGLPPQQPRQRLFAPRSVPLQVLAGAENGLAAGQYRIVGASPHGTRLSLQASGYAAGALDVPPLAPESQWAATLRLAPGLSIRGRVLDLGDSPIEGAQVQLAPADGSAPTRAVTADVEGRFEFVELPSDSWKCWAGAEGFFKTSTAEFDLDADIDNVLIRLTPGARIRGRVLDARGSPVPEAVVVDLPVELVASVDRPPYTPQLLVESQVRARSVAGTSANDGSYALDSVVPGVHLVAAARLPEDVVRTRLESWASNSVEKSESPPDGIQRVVVSLGEQLVLDLHELPVATLRGRVTSAGDPADGATVFVGDAEAGAAGWTAQATCDPQGGFELGSLVPGDVLVLAVAVDEPLPRALVATLIPGEITSVDIAFAGQTVRGVTIDHVTKRPVADVPLDLSWIPSDEAASTEPGLPTKRIFDVLRTRGYARPQPTSDRAGRFEWQHVPAGSYSLRVRGNSWIEKSSPRFVVDDTWSADDVILEVSAGTVVEGRFDVDGAGFDEPARQYTVGLYHPTENTVFRWVDVEGGTYRLQGLGAGSYALRVRRMDTGGHYVFDQAVELSDGEVRRIDIVVSK